MKKSKVFLNILILLVLNAILIIFDYYVAMGLYKMISSDYYVRVLLFFITAIFINPFISYLIDYYLIIDHI